MRFLLRYFGVLRIGLMVLTIALIVVAPGANTMTTLEWPGIVPSLIAPATAPLVLMVLLLDLMMSRIYRVDAAADEQRRMGHISLLNLILAIALAATWLPFFMALGRPL